MGSSTASDQTRIDFVDQVRGFALLGIAVVNAPFFSISIQGSPPFWQLSGWDSATSYLVCALGMGKFYLLFSFLFGYSLSRFIRPETPRGLVRYRRRLLALATLGPAHAVLFNDGDILFTYAMLGCILLPVVQRSDLIVVVFSALAGGFALVMLWLLLAFPGEQSWDAAIMYQMHDMVLRESDFAEASFSRLMMWLWFMPKLPHFPALSLAMMGAGLVAGRHRLLDDPAGHRWTWRVLVWAGLLIGLPLALVAALHDDEIWGYCLSYASAPLLSGGYLGLLAFAHGIAPRLLGFLESAGRMSLTCYVLQSVIMSTIYCGYGFGLFGTHGVALSTLVALTAAAAIALFAKLWLMRFDHGPLEQLVAGWCGAR